MDERYDDPALERHMRRMRDSFVTNLEGKSSWRNFDKVTANNKHFFLIKLLKFDSK